DPTRHLGCFHCQPLSFASHPGRPCCPDVPYIARSDYSLSEPGPDLHRRNGSVGRSGSASQSATNRPGRPYKASRELRRQLHRNHPGPSHDERRKLKLSASDEILWRERRGSFGERLCDRRLAAPLELSFEPSYIFSQPAILQPQPHSIQEAHE